LVIAAEAALRVRLRGNEFPFASGFNLLRYSVQQETVRFAVRLDANTAKGREAVAFLKKPA